MELMPFYSLKSAYSMTPMMISILNLPRNITNLFENIVLLGIIPGNGRLSPNPASYLEIAVDEMLALSRSSMHSAYDNTSFTVKLKFLLHVSDYPGMSKLFNLHGANSISGCHYYEIRGQYNKNLSKVIYSDNGSYLPLSSLLRGDVKEFATKTYVLLHNQNYAYPKVNCKIRKGSLWQHASNSLFRLQKKLVARAAILLFIYLATD